MKKLKKFLGLCLSCVMLTALMPAVVFADEEITDALEIEENTGAPESGEIMNATDPGEIPSLDDLLEDAGPITLPCRFEYDLKDAKPYRDGEKTRSGYAIKVELQKNYIFNFNYFGKEDDIDTYFAIYKKIDGTFKLLKEVDEDNYDESGEEFKYLVPETGTYYILLGAKANAGICIVEANARASEKPYRSLDFTAESLPEHAEGDLWDWEKDTKTLTLHDGFQIVSIDPAIKLPEESVVSIEGKAEITSDDNECISSEGNCKIIGKGLTESELTLIAEEEVCIYSKEGVTIENVALNTTSAVDTEEDLTISNSVLNATGYDAINSGGYLIISNSLLSIDVESSAIRSYDNITITDSTLNIITDIFGIISRSAFNVTNSTLDINSKRSAVVVYESFRGEESTISIVSPEGGVEVSDDVTFNNSKIKIDTSSGENGICSDSGNIAITGGTLDVISAYSTLRVANAYRISLKDVKFNLKTTQEGYPLIFTENSTDFSLPGMFKLYDIDGNQLYTGEWSSDLLENHTLAVNGTPVYHAVSGDSPVSPSEPSNPNQPVPTNTKTNTSVSKTPKTGDDTNGFLWFVLLLVSICGITGTTIYSKRKIR